MSYSFTAQPAQSLDEPPISQHALGHNAQQLLQPEGQRHDRIPFSQQTPSTMGGSGNVEITTTQRMVSATWGSILTTLLGTSLSQCDCTRFADSSIVTPLDVVRVRLQSQQAPQPSNLSRFPAYSTSFKHLPPDLGINSCCREVFFVGNNGQFCLAGNGSIQGSSTLTADCAVEETQQKTFTSTMDAL